jgi:hypothetical protein
VELLKAAAAAVELLKAAAVELLKAAEHKHK